MSYWWCLKHQAVEEDSGCERASRIGPYDTEREAAGALKRIAKREEEQKKGDEEEDKWGKE